MDKFLVAPGALILFGFTLILGAILGALMGAFAGWIVGWTPLGTWILHVLGTLGAHGFTMAELGAACGFIGGFMKTNVEHKKD